MDALNIFSLIFSTIALIATIITLWKNFLKPFKLKITNTNPCLTIYKITPDISGSDGDVWWIPSVDIGISFHNLGKKNGEILDVRIVTKSTYSKLKEVFEFRPKWIVDYAKFSQHHHERLTWIRNATIRGWYPILLRGGYDVHLHIILETTRWEEIISGDLTLSLQVKTSKKQIWETLKRYNIFMFDDLFTKQDSIIARLLE